MAEISVIMGIHNSSDKTILKQAIDSILNQTFTDFEFIICDDGSTDDTFDFLYEYQGKDKRIVLIKNDKNLGLAAALNHCLQYAKGKYIARMDADDISENFRLKKQYFFLEKHPEYGFVGACVKLIDSNGVWGERCLKEFPQENDFLFRQPFVHPSILMRKSSYFAVNGYRDIKKTLRTEDYDLFMRLYAMNIKGYNLQEFLLYYREDKVAYKKRKYKYRINEMRVRYEGFKKLNLLPKGYIYIIKPLIVGFIPNIILKKLKSI